MENWGITPLAFTFLKKMFPYPERASTASWIRAPPESLMPMQGAPLVRARSSTLQIFFACISPSEPPITVKSWLNTYTIRPSMVPYPVTTPSPRKTVSWSPKLTQRCSTNSSISTKLPGSRIASIRSRAVILPFSCCLAMAFAPPPCTAFSRFSTRLAHSSSIVLSAITTNLLDVLKLSVLFSKDSRAADTARGSFLTQY